MKFQIGEEEDGRLSISGEPGRWDGQPVVNRVLIDASPLREDRDRTAVGLTLFYSEFLAGSVQFPDLIDVVTAKAIRDFCSPRDVFPAQVHDGPKKTLEGSNHLAVRHTRDLDVPLDESQLQRTVVSIPKTVFSGKVQWLRGSALATNLDIFSLGNSHRMEEALVGLSVLFAQDFDATVIVVPERLHRHDQVASLLGAVGLSLLTEDESRNHLEVLKSKVEKQS